MSLVALISPPYNLQKITYFEIFWLWQMWLKLANRLRSYWEWKRGWHPSQKPSFFRKNISMTHTVITGIAMWGNFKRIILCCVFSTIIMFLQFLQWTGKNIYTHKKGNLQIMTTQDTYCKIPFNSFAPFLYLTFFYLKSKSFSCPFKNHRVLILY